MTDTTSLCDLEISEVAPLLRDRTLSPVELTEAYLERITRLDPRLNSYIRVIPAEARAAARVAELELGRGASRGPLEGVPLGIKDLLDVAGVPNTLGQRMLRGHRSGRRARLHVRHRAPCGRLRG